MNLKEYLDHLNRQVALNPDLLDYQVIYASDDEGNRYEPVKYTPTPGRFENDRFESEYTDHNAICLN